LRPFCNAVTTLPEAPRANSGVFGSGRKRLPRYRPYDAIHRQACALLEIFDGLFRCRVEGAGDIARPEHLGHYKDTLKSSYIATSRTDADCWAIVHGFTLPVFSRFSRRNFVKIFHH
jgi:hypothetical protein